MVTGRKNGHEEDEGSMDHGALDLGHSISVFQWFQLEEMYTQKGRRQLHQKVNGEGD